SVGDVNAKFLHQSRRQEITPVATEAARSREECSAQPILSKLAQLRNYRGVRLFLSSPHSRKTVHRGVQVTSKIGGRLCAHTERRAGILFERERGGQRHPFEMLDQSSDAGF